MSTEQEQAIARIMGDFYDRISQAYKQIVGSIEGWQPTDEEIKEHGQRFIDADGRTFLAWKGIPIVEWDAWPMRWGDDGTSAVITFRKSEPNASSQP